MNIMCILIGILIGVGMIIIGDLYFIRRENNLKYFLCCIVLETFGGCIFGYFSFILLMVFVEKFKWLGDLSYLVSALIVIGFYFYLVLWLPSKIILFWQKKK